MGRVKLKIKRLETATARQITYSKRKIGLAKKAMELSTLCDIDVALVMFSPTGKPTICVGGNNDLSGILQRFSSLPFEERSRKKLEILKILKKTYEKIGHNIDVQKLLGEGNQKVEDLQTQLRLMQALIQEKDRKLSCWTNPDEIEGISQINALEKCLIESLNRLHKQKVHLAEHHMRGTWAASQAQHFRWLSEQHIAHGRLHADPNFAIAQCDFGCYGNASGPGENIGSGFKFDFQYPYQQRNYNLMGTENLKLEMDLNLNKPYYNQVQQFKPCYEASLQYHT